MEADFSGLASEFPVMASPTAAGFITSGLYVLINPMTIPSFK
jgi:hypothetical protein